MEGKKTFTPEEAVQIMALIRKKLAAKPEQQKGIRDKIRMLGFYYSDFSDKQIPGGYNEVDFLRFIEIKK